uniref:Uncharacterized protein n=1 Tax=Cucumis melo TaxID=3656 RepID=A0A9I9EIE7_CUCME
EDCEEARSPFVKKYKTVIHPGEYRNLPSSAACVKLPPKPCRPRASLSYSHLSRLVRWILVWLRSVANLSLCILLGYAGDWIQVV